MPKAPDYITGLGREYPHPRIAHIYEGPFDAPGRPLCRHGWNRNGGQSYSIWRNNTGTARVCKVCDRRAAKGLPGVDPKEEK